MNSKEKRILVVSALGAGGVSNLMTNIQERIDRDKLNFDYLVFHDERPYKADLVESLGSKIYVASTDNIKFRPLRRIARLGKIRKICRENNVKVLHYNSDIAADLTNIIAARMGGVKHVTMHAHNASYTVPGLSPVIASKICKPFLPLVSNNFWACSNLAGNFVFPKSVVNSDKYKMIPNGINLEKYDYNPQIRSDLRKELGIADNAFVIGHAGRFVEQKNHRFLLQIFKAIQEKDQEIVFLCFGKGVLMDEMKEYAKKLGVNVRFMGNSDSMEKMWQVMDVFVMPSLHEGLPVAGIEAQASGLKCFFADTITKEVDVTGQSVFLSLNDSPEKWAQTILDNKNYVRTSNIDKLRAAGYDIDLMAANFQDYYLGL